MFVYLLKSKVDGSQYVGMTSNLEQRLAEHNRGSVKSTKAKIPWQVLYYEEAENRILARVREKHLKSAAGRRFRKKLLGM